MVNKTMKDGDDLKEDVRMLLDAPNESVDHVNKDNIKGLIEDIKDLE